MFRRQMYRLEKICNLQIAFDNIRKKKSKLELSRTPNTGTKKVWGKAPLPPNSLESLTK